MIERVVIVGAGHAGVQTAASLREYGFAGELILLGAETHLPYHRPPLSKGKISAADGVEKIALRGSAFYKELEIGISLGERVHEVDLDSGSLQTTQGRHLEFDSFAMALGSKVRHLSVPGADLPGVQYLRDLDDALRLNIHIERARSMVVVGGGFIGLEAAAVANAAGLKVTVVESDSRLMSRSASPLVSSVFAELHRARGIEILLESTVEEIVDHDGRAGGVRLRDGTVVDGDFVLVGIGVLPRTGLATTMGLEVIGGIVVDADSRTSDPRVVAAGDCTVSRQPHRPDVLLSLESVHNATLQAKNAAKVLCGLDDRETEVPWFWSHQGDLKLQMAGFAATADETVIRGHPDEGKFTALHFCGAALVGVDCVNRPAEFAILKRAMQAGATFDRGRVADVSVSMRELASA